MSQRDSWKGYVRNKIQPALTVFLIHTLINILEKFIACWKPTLLARLPGISKGKRLRELVDMSIKSLGYERSEELNNTASDVT